MQIFSRKPTEADRRSAAYRLLLAVVVLVGCSSGAPPTVVGGEPHETVGVVTQPSISRTSIDVSRLSRRLIARLSSQPPAWVEIDDSRPGCLRGVVFAKARQVCPTSSAEELARTGEPVIVLATFEASESEQTAAVGFVLLGVPGSEVALTSSGETSSDADPASGMVLVLAADNLGNAARFTTPDGTVYVCAFQYIVGRPDVPCSSA
jgi:hypothetical protein